MWALSLNQANHPQSSDYLSLDTLSQLWTKLNHIKHEKFICQTCKIHLYQNRIAHLYENRNSRIDRARNVSIYQTWNVYIWHVCKTSLWHLFDWSSFVCWDEISSYWWSDLDLIHRDHAKSSCTVSNQLNFKS